MLNVPHYGCYGAPADRKRDTGGELPLEVLPISTIVLMLSELSTKVSLPKPHLLRQVYRRVVVKWTSPQ